VYVTFVFYIPDGGHIIGQNIGIHYVCMTNFVTLVCMCWYYYCICIT